MVWCLHRIRRKKLDLSEEEKKNIDFNLNPKQRESALKAISKIKQTISDLNKFKQYIEERKKEWLEAAENDGDSLLSFEKETPVPINREFLERTEDSWPSPAPGGTRTGVCAE
jgi:hypothetical protein